MKTIKILSLTTIIALPVLLTGCESLFSDNTPRQYVSTESYDYENSGYYGGGSSRSYGRGGNGGGSTATSKPRSSRPSTSSTADSVDSSTAVPIEPPSLD